MEEKQTGNPVFDYRASFRLTAATIQRVLIGGGLLLFLVFGVLFLLDTLDGNSIVAGCVCLAGALLSLIGIVWGFCWRNTIRREFRERYGPRGQ